MYYLDIVLIWGIIYLNYLIKCEYIPGPDLVDVNFIVMVRTNMDERAIPITERWT